MASTQKRTIRPKLTRDLLRRLKRWWRRLDERKVQQASLITLAYLIALMAIGYLPWIIIFSPDEPDAVVATIGSGEQEGSFPLPTEGKADTGDLEEAPVNLLSEEAGAPDVEPPPLEPRARQVPDLPLALGTGDSSDLMEVLADDAKGPLSAAQGALEGESSAYRAASSGPANFVKSAGEGFSQRRGEAKQRALRAGGGSDATERAVRLALEWLKQHQDDDGGWLANRSENRTAVTGLAVLCFLGAGESESSRDYGRTVKTALEFLLNRQSPDGTYPRTNNYTLAIGTMALAEACVMDGRTDVARAASRGVEEILKRQCPAGGWDYNLPGTRNDMSVSGWVIMALKSASVGRILGAEKAYPKFRELIDETIGSRAGGWYSVHRPERVERLRTADAMHAVCMLSRLFMGEHGTRPLLEGAAMQAKKLPVWGSRHTYRVYYATLAIFQVGGSSWRTWNRHVARMLVKNQRQDGDFKGSWDAGQGHGEDTGRAYITSLCCLTLEVYYRYAAIYR